MALTEAQLASLAELIGESYAETSAAYTGALIGLSAGEITAVEGRLTAIATAYDTVKDKHLKVSGGRDGIDLDYERNRAALRDRARTALKMSASSEMPTFFTVARGCRGR